MAGGSCYIGTGARQGMSSLEFDSVDAVHCIAGLAGHNFEKSTPPRDKGSWRDIYTTVYLGVPVYIKFAQSSDGRFVLESFKKNTNAD